MSDIRRSIEFDASVETTWAYLTESDKIAQWLMPNTFQAVLGHRFTMDCPPGLGSGEPIDAVVTEIVPPANNRAHLVYTWRIEHPLRETVVEIHLTETNGVTRLDLTHSGWDNLTPEEAHIRERHDQGWDFLLGQRLRALLDQ